MSKATFVMLGRLRFFVAKHRGDQAITVEFRERQSIKHLAESLGVPHPEIGRVVVNGEERHSGAITQDQDLVEIHPVLDGCPVEPRFVLDAHLGRLAAHLRMLGFDCLYRNDYQDAELAQTASEETRILLTRDRRLLMRKAVIYGYCLRSLEPLEQTTEVLRRFRLASLIHPFHRCMRCNHPLELVSKEQVIDRLEPLTRKYYEEFHICPACKQIYWRGSHYERMSRLVEELNKA